MGGGDEKFPHGLLIHTQTACQQTQHAHPHLSHKARRSSDVVSQMC
jgi:hypothetical protein